MLIIFSQLLNLIVQMGMSSWFGERERERHRRGWNYLLLNAFDRAIKQENPSGAWTSISGAPLTFLCVQLNRSAMFPQEQSNRKEQWWRPAWLFWGVFHGSVKGSKRNSRGGHSGCETLCDCSSGLLNSSIKVVYRERKSGMPRRQGGQVWGPW